MKRLAAIARRVNERFEEREAAPRFVRGCRALGATMLAAIVWLFVGAAFTPLPAALQDGARYGTSVVFVDREGELLREVRADDSARAVWVPLDDVGDDVVHAVLAAEDRRFEDHVGVEVARAFPITAPRGMVSVCSAEGRELLWLERTWSNLPEQLRKVGPLEEVSSAMAIGISFVPGVAWVWKLGLVVGIANGFEAVRAQIPFAAPVPRRLGMAAVIVGWIPGLNVYVAPFLWEMFAVRIDACVRQIMAARSV